MSAPVHLAFRGRRYTRNWRCYFPVLPIAAAEYPDSKQVSILRSQLEVLIGGFSVRVVVTKFLNSSSV